MLPDLDRDGPLHYVSVGPDRYVLVTSTKLSLPLPLPERSVFFKGINHVKYLLITWKERHTCRYNALSKDIPHMHLAHIWTLELVLQSLMLLPGLYSSISILPFDSIFFFFLIGWERIFFFFFLRVCSYYQKGPDMESYFVSTYLI